MEIEGENNISNIHLKNIILKYYQWEKQKPKLLLTNEDNINSFNNEVFYLINKMWINNFKNLINYENIVKILANNYNNKKEEEIIDEYLSTEINNINKNQLSLNDIQINDDNSILKELMENKNFAFEIINEEFKNSLDEYDKKEYIQVNRKFINNKILFELNSSFDNKNILILFISIEDNNFYELFFIMDCNLYISFIKEIETYSKQQILDICKISSDNIDENGEIKNINLNDNSKFDVVIKKLKKNNIEIPINDNSNNDNNNNIENINNSNNILNDNTNNNMINNINNGNNDINSNINNNNSNNNSDKNSENSDIISNNNNEINSNINLKKIKESFSYFNKCNKMFKKALSIGEIHNNYSPCKLINKQWIEEFIKTFEYKEDENNIKIKDNISLKDFELFKNFDNLIPNDFEKGEFYIVNENFFLSLFPFNDELENKRELFKDYEIFLKEDKGAIIIDDNIYIFETSNNNINKRNFFQKICGQKKNELLNKMKNEIFEFELTQTNWEELKSNIFINNSNNINNNINNNMNNINNDNNSYNNLNNNGKINSMNNINNNNPIINNENNHFNEMENFNKNNNNMINPMNNNNNININEINKNINLPELNKKNNININNNINNNFNINNNINNNKDNKMNNDNNPLSKLNSLMELEIKLTQRNNYLNSLEKELNDKEDIIKKVFLNKNNPTLGLENLGATCYMNAPLQCMAHFMEVSEGILTWYKSKKDKNKKSKTLSYAYATVLNNLYFPNEYNNSKKFYSPKEFKEIISKLNPLFKGIQANDSKDIFNYMIEQMHKELNNLDDPIIFNNNLTNLMNDQSNEMLTLNQFKTLFAINFNSIFSKYLYGIQETITKCDFCGINIYNFQTFNFLIFPLLDVQRFVYNNFSIPQNYTLHLNDCFNYYEKIEYFFGENSIHCNNCNLMRNATYFNKLYSVPKIISIVLNRGKNNADFKGRINFDMKLDLSNHVIEDSNSAKYYLFGVVCHIGDSSMSGHFFAYCRSHFKSPWYKYNDSIVNQCNEKEILSAYTPYILFYHKYD